MHIGTLKGYTLGFLLSLLLTFAAYFAATKHLGSDLMVQMVVATLGLIQVWVQFALFFSLGKEAKPYWNLLSFLFMVMVTLIIVIGSLWIMKHLNYNLM